MILRKKNILRKSFVTRKDINKMTEHPYMLSNKTVTIILNGKQFTYTSSQPYFDELKKLLSQPKDKIQWNKVVDIINAEEHLINYTGKNISVCNGRFYYRNQEGTTIELAENAIINRILDMQNKRKPFDNMLKFLDNLAANPDIIAINELYLFLSDCDMPITDDGHFLAYKKIRKDYTDCYTGTICNKIGSLVTMLRENVDNDRTRTCSNGLHFCAKGYLPHFSSSDDIVVAVKINPADVVSIPADYNNMKGRCCKYYVVAELDENQSLNDFVSAKTDVQYIVTAENPDNIIVPYKSQENTEKFEKMINTVEQIEEPEEIKEKLDEEVVFVANETPEPEKTDVVINTDDDEETDFASLDKPYIGTVKGFLKDVGRESRVVNRDYYISTSLGVSLYRFIKTVGDKAFTFIKKISKAVKKDTIKKVSEEPVKKSNLTTEVLFDNGSLKVEKVTNNSDSTFWNVHGTVKEFLRKFPKEKRVANVKMFFFNNAGMKVYRFEGKTSEKVFKQID